MRDKLTTCSLVVIIFSFLARQVPGLPLHSKTDSDLESFDLKDEHKRAVFRLNGQPNARGQDGLPPSTNGTDARSRERISALRIRRSSDLNDDDYGVAKHEDYYEGGGAAEVGGGRKRMIAFTIFFVWVCWVSIALSILRIVAKNMA